MFIYNDNNRYHCFPKCVIITLLHGEWLQYFDLFSISHVSVPKINILAWGSGRDDLLWGSGWDNLPWGSGQDSLPLCDDWT